MYFQIKLNSIRTKNSVKVKLKRKENQNENKIK